MSAKLLFLLLLKDRQLALLRAENDRLRAGLSRRMGEVGTLRQALIEAHAEAGALRILYGQPARLGQAGRA